MEPDAQRPDQDGGGEEGAQDFPPAPAEADERGRTGDEKQRSVGDREPGHPRLAEHFPVFEADLGLRIDVEPGKTAQVRFVPEKAGTFLFHCDIFCGTGHEEMAGTMVVRPRKEARDGR